MVKVISTNDVSLTELADMRTYGGEVLAARGSFGSLSGKLGDVDSKISTNTTNITTHSYQLDILNNRNWIDGVSKYTIDYSGVNNAATLINQALTECPANGVVVLAHGTYKCLSGITIPAGKKLISFGKATLDFSLAPDGTKAVTFNGDGSNIENFILNGNGKAGTSVALDYKGSRITPNNIEVKNFGVAQNFVNNNTYMIDVENLFAHDCGTLAKFHDGTVSNSGERINFWKCTFGNSDLVFTANATTNDIHFHGCSFDYNVKLGKIGTGQVYFHGGHIETRLSTSPQNYLIEWLASPSPSVIFQGTTINLYEGLEFIFQTGGSGSAVYHGVRGFFRPTGGSTDQGTLSEMKVNIPAGTTSVDINSLFVSAVTPVTVQVMAFSDRVTDTNAVTPTFKFYSSSNKITITIPSQASVTQVLVKFG